MAGPSVLVRVLGDTKDLQKSTSAADTALSGLGKVGSAVGNTLMGAFRLASTAVTVAGAATVGFGIDAFKTAARVGEMNATLRALAKGNDDLYATMLKTVDSIRGQGIEAGVAQNLVAQFTRNQLELTDATKLATVAQDAAVISGQNSSETLDQLIHGITTQNSLVLRNAGVNVQAGQAMAEYAKELGKGTTELSEAERAQAVLNAVIAAGGPIAGAYAAAMEEPGKVLRSFPRLFDDIKVTAGEGLVGAFGPLILKLYDLVKAFSNSIKEGGNLRPILDAIMDKVKDLVGPLTTLATKAGEWIKHIPPDTVKKITDLISKIGGAAAGAGSALGVMGLKNIPILGQLLGGINPVVTGVLALLATTEGGRDAFKALMDGVKPLISVFTGQLLPAFNKILGAITPLLPIIISLATTIIDNLLKAITPLIPPITELVGILGAALGEAIKALTPLLNMVGDTLRDIFTAIGPLLPVLGELIAAVLDLAIQAIKPLIPPILELIKAALIPLLPPLIQLMKPITDLITALSPLITLVANLLGIIVSLIAKALAPVIGWIANLVAIVVGGLAKALTGILKPFDDVGGAAKRVFGWVKDNWPLLVAILTGPIGIAVLAIVRNFDSIKAGLAAVVDWFKALPGQVAAGISAGLHLIWNVINSINDRIRSVFNIDLLAAGRRILESLLEGMRQAGQKVIDFAQSVADKVKGLWPFSPAEWGPFRQHPPEKAGAKLVELWAKGMASQERTMEQTAARIAGAASVDGAGNFSLAGNVGPTPAGATASPIRTAPAVVIQEAIFQDDADIEAFMRKATFLVNSAGI